MGTNYIAPTWRQPKNANKDRLSNYSIDTAGTAGIDCGPMADLFGTASVTYNTSYSIWIKPDFDYNTSNYQTFYGNYTSGNNGALFYYHKVDRKWRFFVGDGSGNNFVNSSLITSNEELGKGEWQHHCVVYDTVNNNAYYYINNQQVNSATSLSRKIATNADFYIGKKWDLSSGTFSGLISQGCVFNYALSSDQRTYLYNLNNPMAISGAEPIAYWPLGDNSNPTANAGYPNISVGADSVFDFEQSSSQTIDIVGSTLFDSTSTFSFSAWCKLESYDISFPAIIRLKTDQSTGFIMGFSNYDASYYGVWFGSSSNFLTAKTAGNISADLLGVWKHICLVYDGVDRTAISSYSLYINGVPQSLVSAGSFGATPNTNIIGRGNTVNTFWDGEISNTQIWDTELSQPNVTTLYNNGQPLMTGTQPQAANLKAWWKLNQTATWTGSAWSIPDDSTNSNTGTSVGMNTTNLVQSNLTRKQPFSSYSIEWDAGTDYMDLPATTWTSGQAYTISMWMRKDSFGNIAGTPFVWATGTTVTNIVIWWKNATELTYTNGQNTNTAKSVQGLSLNNNEWYHFCFTATLPSASPSGTDQKIYINGIEQTIGSPTSWISANQSTSAFGRLPNNAGFNYNGLMSNVALFDSILTQDDIINLYNNGVTQDLNNFRIKPKYWWPLDENYTYYDGSSLVARDVIGGVDADGNNLIQENIIGSAPGSESNGTGTNLTIADLKGDMKSSTNNSYSINMADYADDVTNPADSGRSTNVP